MDREHDYEITDRGGGAIEGFYLHATIFVLVVAFLFVVNLMTPGPWWVQWVIRGWGFGVGAHAFAVFVLARRPDMKEKEERIAGKPRP